MDVRFLIVVEQATMVELSKKKAYFVGRIFRISERPYDMTQVH